MPKMTFMSGGPTRHPARWRVTRSPNLSRDYDFVPGVPTDVADVDVPALMNPSLTGGRVFELAPDSALAKAAKGVPATGALAGTLGSATTGSTGAAGAGGHKTTGGTAPDDDAGRKAGEKE